MPVDQIAIGAVIVFGVVSFVAIVAQIMCDSIHEEDDEDFCGR